MRPATSSPSAAQRVDERRRRRRARSRPSAARPPRSPDEHRARRARAGAISAPSSARSTDCHSATHGASCAHLVALQPADEVPARRGAGRAPAALASELLRAVLAEVDDAGGDDRGARASTVDGLRHRDERDRRRVAARAARRGARCARAPRRPRAVDVGRRSRVAHHDHGLAAGDAVAPVREVVGRRRRCTRRRRRGRRPRRARARRAPRPGCRARARPSSVRPATSGPSRVDEPVEVGRRRTRSAPGGCTARAPRATGPAPIARSAATAALDHARLEPAATRRARRRPRRRSTSAIGAQSAVSTTSGRPTRRR